MFFHGLEELGRNFLEALWLSREPLCTFWIENRWNRASQFSPSPGKDHLQLILQLLPIQRYDQHKKWYLLTKYSKIRPPLTHWQRREPNKKALDLQPYLERWTKWKTSAWWLWTSRLHPLLFDKEFCREKWIQRSEKTMDVIIRLWWRTDWSLGQKWETKTKISGKYYRLRGIINHCGGKEKGWNSDN